MILLTKDLRATCESMLGTVGEKRLSKMLMKQRDEETWTDDEWDVVDKKILFSLNIYEFSTNPYPYP